MIKKKCVEKGEGMVVQEEGTKGTTLKTLELDKGWYRFSAESHDVYACPTVANCFGGVINTTNVDKSLCIEGAGESLRVMRDQLPCLTSPIPCPYVPHPTCPTYLHPPVEGPLCAHCDGGHFLNDPLSCVSRTLHCVISI